MVPKRIVAIGASSCFGRVDLTGGGFVERLKKWHQITDENAVFNLGIDGDTTTDVLKRFLPEVSIRKPDLILIHVGLNDSRRMATQDAPLTTPLDQFEKNLQQLFTEAKSLCDIIFVGVNPIDDTKTQPLTDPNGQDFYYAFTDVERYANQTKAVCKKLHIPYLDIFNLLLKDPDKKYLYKDGLHCNDAGHEKIFEELKTFLLQ